VYDFLTENALYIVLLIVLICWIGIFSYLIRLDRRLTKIEQTLKR